MGWKAVVVMTIMGVSPLTAQRHDRHARVDVPRIKVDIPAINVTVPAISVVVPRIRVDEPNVRVDIPPIHVDMPEIPVAIPALNFDFPGFKIDLSHIGHEIDRALRDAVRDLDDWDYDTEITNREVERVRQLKREWRAAIREAETGGDWSRADSLAHQLNRAAERLKR